MIYGGEKMLFEMLFAVPMLAAVPVTGVKLADLKGVMGDKIKDEMD
ncbi:hypothetical protein FACS1894188_01550 [Clostridia bacterium]|nr:hypothetical protein FACS1894188_01550 [Clostridia bacterium]